MKHCVMSGVANIPAPISVGLLGRWLLTLALLGMLHGVMIDDALAVDPPHSNDCVGACHMIHGGFGGGLFNPGALLKFNSNDNLCAACHTPSGPATAVPFANVDQAYPGTTGTSHRWDSGASGHTEADLANTSPGIVYSGGAYTGRIETDYTITISTAGDVGVARFDWVDNGSGGSSTETVRDEFEGVPSYGNNNGSVNWVGNWIENDPQGGGASSGKARVIGGELRLDQQSFSGFGVSAAREADLSGGVTAATFSFDFRTDTGVDATDAVAIEVSNNGGGSYAVLETITGIVGASSGSRSYDILGSAAVNTRVRFRITNSYAGTNEYFYADNVQIEYTTPSAGGGASNVLTGTGVPLVDGLTLSFLDGGTSPSFVLGDTWTLYVRTDLRSPDLGVPAEFDMAARLDLAGKVVCSTCHNQHSQAMQPFDPLAPAYGGRGTGAGRHFQRADNDTNQICKVCHSPRDVQDSDLGSHPVGVLVPGGDYQAPAALPLDAASNVVCMSCHDIHYTDSGGANAGAGDGYLLRQDMSSLCYECHTLADQANGSHFDAVTGALWPGGQYGSSFAGHSADKRGTCVNCHWPHGWPDNDNMAQDYPKLFVERYDVADDGTDPDDAEDLCYTCHDGNPASTNVKSEFAKSVHHPVKDSEQAAGRSVECRDCHNPHEATGGAHTYSTTANANRNDVSGALEGVLGWSVDYSGLGNFVAPAAGNYSDVDPATNEYEICFKCHSGKSWSFGTPPDGLSPNGPSDPNPVQTDVAQEFNPNNRSFHPVVVGLNHASSNSSALQAAQLKAPWNTNRGTQTMMCSDCHGTDAASPAAQGPHGSAAAFILRGPNTVWPPTQNLSLPSVWTTAYNSSVCSNCHNLTWNNEVHRAHDDRGGDGFNLYCYSCHITVPHGGKLGRLIGDRDSNMPARYAYNGNPSNNWIQAFRKQANYGSYDKNDCQAACDNTHDSSPGAQYNWD